ncbi:MAG: hypothetical protein M4579_004605 [Chaenotheca gracillima]|nr:MAG: hypothetical protein M4579_004605 [Chaenotheca gracillima]
MSSIHSLLNSEDDSAPSSPHPFSEPGPEGTSSAAIATNATQPDSDDGGQMSAGETNLAPQLVQDTNVPPYPVGIAREQMDAFLSNIDVRDLMNTYPEGRAHTLVVGSGINVYHVYNAVQALTTSEVGRIKNAKAFRMAVRFVDPEQVTITMKINISALREQYDRFGHDDGPRPLRFEPNIDEEVHVPVWDAERAHFPRAVQAGQHLLSFFTPWGTQNGQPVRRQRIDRGAYATLQYRMAMASLSFEYRVAKRLLEDDARHAAGGYAAAYRRAPRNTLQAIYGMTAPTDRAVVQATARLQEDVIQGDTYHAMLARYGNAIFLTWPRGFDSGSVRSAAGTNGGVFPYIIRVLFSVWPNMRRVLARANEHYPAPEAEQVPVGPATMLEKISARNLRGKATTLDEIWRQMQAPYFCPCPAGEECEQCLADAALFGTQNGHHSDEGEQHPAPRAFALDPPTSSFTAINMPTADGAQHVASTTAPSFPSLAVGPRLPVEQGFVDEHRLTDAEIDDYIMGRLHRVHNQLDDVPDEPEPNGPYGPDYEQPVAVVDESEDQFYNDSESSVSGQTEDPDATDDDETVRGGSDTEDGDVDDDMTDITGDDETFGGDSDTNDGDIDDEMTDISDNHSQGEYSYYLTFIAHRG